MRSNAIQLPAGSVNGLTFAVGCGAAGYVTALLLLDVAAQRAGVPDVSSSIVQCCMCTAKSALVDYTFCLQCSIQCLLSVV
jgi:hypothetical protein